MLRGDMKSLRLRIANPQGRLAGLRLLLPPCGLAFPPSAPSEHAERKRKEKEGKTPLHLTQKKQEKQEKYHKMMRKVKKNLAVTGKKSTFAAVIKLLGINMMQNSNHSV